MESESFLRVIRLYFDNLSINMDQLHKLENKCINLLFFVFTLLMVTLCITPTIIRFNNCISPTSFGFVGLMFWFTFIGCLIFRKCIFYKNIPMIKPIPIKNSEFDLKEYSGMIFDHWQAVIDETQKCFSTVKRSYDNCIIALLISISIFFTFYHVSNFIVPHLAHFLNIPSICGT